VSGKGRCVGHEVWLPGETAPAYTCDKLPSRVIIVAHEPPKYYRHQRGEAVQVSDLEWKFVHYYTEVQP
jgi:hypothetical protein